MAVYAGGGIALVLGGVLLLLARRLVETMSAFSGMDPWHLVFLMVGAIGVPMAVLMAATPEPVRRRPTRSEEHTSERQSLMRISYAVFCLKKKKKYKETQDTYANKILTDKYTKTTQ